MTDQTVQFSDVAIHLMSDNRGVYLPKDWIECQHEDMLITYDGYDEDKAILLSGPDHEYYWDAWDNFLNNAKYKNGDGDLYALYQNGDLWAIPENADIDEDSWPI